MWKMLMEKVTLSHSRGAISRIVTKGLYILIFLLLFIYAGVVIAGNNNPFGGKITITQRDYCSASCGTVGHVINVGPPRGGRFHYVPGSTRLYQFNQIARNGVWVLGTYRPGGSPCLRREGDHCRNVSHEGDIEIVGTSN